MSQTFMNALENETNKAYTENGAKAYKSTKSDLLDLFGQCGALRARPESDIESKFSRAFYEDTLLGAKLLFYCRNIRGGLGERRTFRVALKQLVSEYPEVVRKNIQNIPFYGRWDDLFVLFGTELENDALGLIEKQWFEDMGNFSSDKPISLLAKWLPSVNASSKETKANAKIVRKYLGMPEKNYRKALSSLRKYIDVVEKKMSAREWTSINYSAVPSKAMNNYRNAFKAHDEAGFDAYMTKVESGEVKINSSTLYPYDIVEKFLGYGSVNDRVLEAQWNALPNYVEGENSILVMADVSGSMSGRPMATSIGLAMYFAERNQGVFHNKFMTFSGNPSLQNVKGRTLRDRIRNLERADWQMNTDFEKALDLILNTAVQNNISQDELPKSLVVISDMQFDKAKSSSGYGYRRSSIQSSSSNWSFYDQMKDKYTSQGYQIPNIVFWNVADRNDSFQAQCNYEGVQLVSGQSASTFKSVITGIGMTPYELMLEVLNDEMYDRVVV